MAHVRYMYFVASNMSQVSIIILVYPDWFKLVWGLNARAREAKNFFY